MKSHVSKPKLEKVIIEIDKEDKLKEILKEIEKVFTAILGDSAKYEFTVPNKKLIDWNEIGKNLSRKNPIINVTIENEMYVVVSSSIIEKAEITKKSCPKNSLVIFKNTKFVIFFLVKTNSYARSFKAWERWVLRVIKSPWGEYKEECNVKVQIPKIKL